MRYLFIFIVGLFAFNVAFAQKDTAVYYLKTSGQLVSTKDSADYYLVISPPDASVNKGLFIVKEYYPNGKIRYTGNSNSNKLQQIYPKYPGYVRPVLQGSCISFFPDGQKMKVENYDNGDGVGDEMEYYPNGKLYCVKVYRDKKLKCYECRDSTGKVLVQNGSGKWLTFIDERFKGYVEGQVANGLEEGYWYGKQGDATAIVYEYKAGELKSIATIDKTGQKLYSMADVVPEFPGGVPAFGKFLSNNIKYPDDARRRNIQGRVIISFVSETDGTLGDVRVTKSVDPSIDEEAVRVIKQCPRWKPGMQDGVPIRVAYSVPITFTLGK